MEEFIVTIEETVVQEFRVRANNFEQAKNISKEKYDNCEFVLSPGEVQYKQMSITDSKNISTEWFEF